jgi:hypothetical protein
MITAPSLSFFRVPIVSGGNHLGLRIGRDPREVAASDGAIILLVQ